uniref:Cathepsin B3 n=1 Tax=Dysdercus peruvianus TaxID=685034 RepID=A0A7U3NI72_9HEMI|nr:cathepsin B3 [Dysdercus peruvianus]
MKLFLATCLLLGAANAATFHQESLRSIAEKVNSLQTTWQAKTDLPASLTASSFKRLLGAKRSLHKTLMEVEEPLTTVSEIPEEFDARKQWPNCLTIGHIRDQGNCGSCWAVAASATFSDRLCIASKGKFVLPLSDQELLTCCSSCGDGCDGGYPKAAWDYFKNHGIVTGGGYNSSVGCQPYSVEACEHHTSGSRPSCDSTPDLGTPDCVNHCTNSKYTIPFGSDHHKVSKSYYVSSKVSAIQQEILAHGPVEAAFDVYADFPTYKSGVYHQTSGSYLGGHAVRVIGWGTENNTPYWLIANSWNNDWGDNGLFKIRRGNDECGIESEMTAGLPIV